jgi:hypothetical protein
LAQENGHQRTGRTSRRKARSCKRPRSAPRASLGILRSECQGANRCPSCGASLNHCDAPSESSCAIGSGMLWPHEEPKLPS